MLKGFHSYLGVSSVITSELMGIWQGLKISKDLGMNKIIIESDSKLALLLIRKPDQNWHWKLHTLLSKILALCSHREIRFAHIYREGNSVADCLASLGLKNRSSIIYVLAEIPVRARQLAFSDKIGLAYVRKVFVSSFPPSSFS